MGRAGDWASGLLGSTPISTLLFDCTCVTASLDGMFLGSWPQLNTAHTDSNAALGSKPALSSLYTCFLCLSLPLCKTGTFLLTFLSGDHTDLLNLEPWFYNLCMPYNRCLGVFVVALCGHLCKAQSLIMCPETWNSREFGGWGQS